MDCTHLNRHTTFSSWAPTAPLMLGHYGKLKLKARIVSLRGFWSKKKIQTADNLLLKGIQCDPMCCLCDQDLESASHLCLHCCFAQQVCFLVHAWSQGLISLPAPDVTVQDWWNLSLQAANAADKGSVAALLISTAWNIWNERNMCIFQGISQEPQRILGLTKQEMAIREQACEPRGHILIL